MGAPGICTLVHPKYCILDSKYRALESRPVNTALEWDCIVDGNNPGVNWARVVITIGCEGIAWIGK